MSDSIKVSVWVVTYNHEKYISECLNGIINQKTNFDFEVIVGEDCSTDNTRKICEEYVAKYNNIVLLPNTKNLGLVKNWERTLNACKGKYVAMCEGDDYWNQPNKLQTQVDFLEANPDYSISFHKVNVFFEDGVKHHNLFEHLEEREFSAKEVYDKWTILTSSVVFRNFKEKISFPKSIYITDIFLSLYLLEKGKAFCHNFVGVAYRRHLKSISLSSSTIMNIKLFYQYKYMYKRFPDFKSISYRKKNDYLDQLIYEPFFRGIWKFRFYKMLQEPRLFFSTFFYHNSNIIYF
jgi:glycosyltransferase involved in cell wall biosynthesis